MFGNYRSLGAEQRRQVGEQLRMNQLKMYPNGPGLNAAFSNSARAQQRVRQTESPLYGKSWINKEVIKEADVVDITDRKLLT